jgi:hydroxylamine reductase
VKNIRLGPSLPAFVTPAVLNVLVEKFGLKGVTKPAADLAEILGPAPAARA